MAATAPAAPCSDNSSRQQAAPRCRRGRNAGRWRPGPPGSDSSAPSRLAQAEWTPLRPSSGNPHTAPPRQGPTIASPRDSSAALAARVDFGGVDNRRAARAEAASALLTSASVTEAAASGQAVASAAAVSARRSSARAQSEPPGGLQGPHLADGPSSSSRRNAAAASASPPCNSADHTASRSLDTDGSPSWAADAPTCAATMWLWSSAPTRAAAAAALLVASASASPVDRHAATAASASSPRKAAATCSARGAPPPAASDADSSFSTRSVAGSSTSAMPSSSSLGIAPGGTALRNSSSAPSRASSATRSASASFPRCASRPRRMASRAAGGSLGGASEYAAGRPDGSSIAIQRPTAHAFETDRPSIEAAQAAVAAAAGPPPSPADATACTMARPRTPLGDSHADSPMGPPSVPRQAAIGKSARSPASGSTTPSCPFGSSENDANAETMARSAT
mmetsp:Transcript_44602/g.112865  ORF Transcript_44602/g.112865 Transcript_44602/m.112865 type:complete len:453 (+) Transcript_44602:832-2190(+)